MRAYKGFHKNLSCTLGKGTFYFEPGKWYREKDAKCANTGFHATDNPLDVLSYYNEADDRYFIVELGGNVDEDGTNSRIAAPKIRLCREITIDEMYKQGVIWLVKHPKAQPAKVIKSETGEPDGRGNLIVRGKHPRARGNIGDKLYIIREDRSGNILEVGAFVVDGEKILPDVYYDVQGRKVNAKK